MTKQTYYATPENMLGSLHGSIGSDWLEVVIIGTLRNKDNLEIYLVETLDGSKRFTTFAEHTFTKTQGETTK